MAAVPEASAVLVRTLYRSLYRIVVRYPEAIDASVCSRARNRQQRQVRESDQVREPSEPMQGSETGVWRRAVESKTRVLRRFPGPFSLLPWLTGCS